MLAPPRMEAEIIFVGPAAGPPDPVDAPIDGDGQGNILDLSSGVVGLLLKNFRLVAHRKLHFVE